MHSVKAKAVAALAAVGLGLVLMASSCDDQGDGPGQRQESKIQQDNYNRLTKIEPAHTMDTSPTRRTINFWIDTWGKDPNKLAYVYLQASNGQLVGYYIFKGLPVSYCASLTPTYKVQEHSGDNGGNLVLPAPGIDGVYYSGGQCSAYFGRDATSGSYIEYTAGQGISALIYDRPLPRQDVKPLGFATVKNVK